MEDSTKYLKDVLYNIKGVLSGPESALLLRELYDEKFNNILPTNEELVLGSVLKRKSESVEDFNTLGYLVKEYLNYNIKKFFGLTLSEYIDSTTFFKRTLIKEAKVAMEKLEVEMKKLSEDPKKLLDDLEEI